MRKTLGTIGTIGLALALTACSSGPTELEKIYETCGKPYEFSVEDDGKILSVKDTNDGNDLNCLFEEIGLPDWLYVKVGNTTMLDGWQEGSFDNYNIEWQYNPDYGASIIIKQNQ